MQRKIGELRELGELRDMKTIKEKRDALLTLIEGSILLSYEQKLDVIENFPLLSEEQIDALGAFLAAEEKIREEFGEDIQQGVEKVLSEIVGETIAENNTVYVGTGKAN